MFVIENIRRNNAPFEKYDCTRNCATLNKSVAENVCSIKDHNHMNQHQFDL